jgi:hypothetical protein
LFMAFAGKRNIIYDKRKLVVTMFVKFKFYCNQYYRYFVYFPFDV